MKKPDINTNLMTEEEFERNCMHYSDFAFFTPPEKFLFHHYDESPEELMICHRPIGGIEKYVVNGKNGGFYGIYDTRDIAKYLKMRTWIEVEDPLFFLRNEEEILAHQLSEKRAAIDAAIAAAKEAT